MILVDSNVVLDVVTSDPGWADWSQATLETAAAADRLAINHVVYAELSVRFSRVEDIDAVLEVTSLSIEPMPRTALFLAGKTYKSYRSSGGTRTGVLPDFFIGAQAAVLGAVLITRDPRRYRTYFPSVKLVSP